MQYYYATENQDFIIRLIRNQELWLFVLEVATIIFVFRVFGILDTVLGIIDSCCSIIKTIVVAIYVHFMLLAYQRTSGVDMVEYRRNTKCTFRGIICNHVTNADVILIEHLPIFKPIIAIFYFFYSVWENLNKRRELR